MTDIFTADTLLYAALFAIGVFVGRIRKGARHVHFHMDGHCPRAQVVLMEPKHDYAEWPFHDANDWDGKPFLTRRMEQSK